MKNSILIALCAVLFMASCRKDEKLEITMKQSGSLSASIRKTDGSPIANEPVYLYQYSTYMDSKKTDANGNVNFGTLLIGNYSIVLEDVEVDNKTFNISQMAPITIGNEINLNIIPEEYVGLIEVSITSRLYDIYLGNYVENPLSGVKVYAIPYDEYNYNSNDIDELISQSVSQGTTSSSGIAVLDGIPASQSIRLFYYTVDKTDWTIYGSTLSVKKFEEKKITIVTNN